MTKLLEQAVAKARELPESEQDEIARLVLAEIEGDRMWDKRLSKLADKAWAEHEAGLSDELDPDKL
jgi:hypothetical protein